MDIDVSVINQVGDATYARWKDAALADLANIICQKDLFPITDDYAGIVVGDGRHIALLAWYSEVTNVQTTDGVTLDFCELRYGRRVDARNQVRQLSDYRATSQCRHGSHRDGNARVRQAPRPIILCIGGCHRGRPERS